jgi:hypothetical protein
MLLQDILCWGSTEIKDDLTQPVTNLSFGVGRSLSALNKTFCGHFSQSWALSCVFELLESYDLITHSLVVKGYRFVCRARLALAEWLNQIHVFGSTGSVRFESTLAPLPSRRFVWFSSARNRL